MSALDEYHKFVVVVRFDSHVTREDVDAVAEGVRLLQAKADAAIAELETQVADLDELYRELNLACNDHINLWMKAEAEYKLLRERLDDCLRGHYGLDPAKRGTK